MNALLTCRFSLFVLLASACLLAPGSGALAQNSPQVSESAAGSAEKSAPEMGLALILPRGAAQLGGTSDKYAAELAALLEKAAALPTGSVRARAFADPEEAARQIALWESGGIILGDLSFYASHRDTLGLAPFLSLTRSEAKTGEEALSRWHVVVKKGRFASLADLKGRTLVGTPLAEDRGFLERGLFWKSGFASRDFQLLPTAHPLREIRRLASEGRDAVVLDDAQFLSLRKMAAFEELDVIYTSQPVPALGAMLRRASLSDAQVQAMARAMKSICTLAEGASLCQSFGISGFADADAAAVNAFADSLKR